MEGNLGRLPEPESNASRDTKLEPSGAERVSAPAPAGLTYPLLLP